MIRINLNGEKRGAPVKTKRKKRKQKSEVEQNIILILLVLIGIGVFFLIGWKINSDYDEQAAIKAQKQAEYKKLEHWEQKKLELDIQKELLNEKIQKISQLKSRREGPVKLLEDVFNNLPKSIWLKSIVQGYDRRLTDKVDPKGRALTPGRNIGKPNDLMIKGMSKTQDAPTTFANSIQGLDSKYNNVILESIVEEKETSVPVFQFTLFLKLVPGYEKILEAEQKGEQK
ncbi:MAG: hypothetical protein CSA81_06860 [Acidobacteria bacterium]|nr:MAG: hypothetical protein CSA81_06860 [Acidobacteriota bacterium]